MPRKQRLHKGDTLSQIQKLRKDISSDPIILTSPKLEFLLYMQVVLMRDSIKVRRR